MLLPSEFHGFRGENYNKLNWCSLTGYTLFISGCFCDFFCVYNFQNFNSDMSWHRLICFDFYLTLLSLFCDFCIFFITECSDFLFLFLQTLFNLTVFLFLWVSNHKNFEYFIFVPSILNPLLIFSFSVFSVCCSNWINYFGSSLISLLLLSTLLLSTSGF